MSGMNGVHPTLQRALKLDDEGWTKGSGWALVHTNSGAVYELHDDGKICGGSKQIRDGKLVGAVYRDGGPIRRGRAVVGLRMEIDVPGTKGVISSRVMKIEEVFG